MNKQRKINPSDRAWLKGQRPPANEQDDPDDLLRRLQQVLGMGRPLNEVTRRHMEGWFGRDLGDVRIHDSRQAIELARRMGAEAFTLDNHVFGPAERLNEPTPNGSGLLAHELTHVIQQTAPDRVSQSREPPTKPGYHAADAPSEENRVNGDTPRPRQSMAVHEGLRPWPGAPTQETGAISLEAPALSVQRTPEGHAQANENVMRSAVEDRAVGSVDSQSPAPEVNREELAHKVYQLMVQDIRLERERGAAGR